MRSVLRGRSIPEYSTVVANGSQTGKTLYVPNWLSVDELLSSGSRLEPGYSANWLFSFTKASKDFGS
jgi:hypothetical protein